MKNKLWLLQIPIVILCTFAFWVEQAGVNGNLTNHFLRDEAFPILRTVAGSFTNVKFRIRGPEKPKNKIVIVDINSEAIARYGRWPWHRDKIAKLIEKVIQGGAKVVGLDAVFSEPDQRVPDSLRALIGNMTLDGAKISDQVLNSFETDFDLFHTFLRYPDRIVLGWAADDGYCQTAYYPSDLCPALIPESANTYGPTLKNMEKFAYGKVEASPAFDFQKTPLVTANNFVQNLPGFVNAVNAAGFFSAFPDPDGYIRRSPQVLMVNGHPYPSLALAMAQVGLQDQLVIRLNSDGKVDSIGFAKSGKTVAVSPLGSLEMNFRGPQRTFKYVTATSVLEGNGTLQVDDGRQLASISANDAFEDAYVLIGVTAVGVFDMRAFPFGSNVPGVEGHATMLDNILSSDMLTRGSGRTNGELWLYLLMTIGALAFAFATQRLNAIPALLLAIGTLGGFSFFDVKVLFEHQVNWNTSLTYLEFGAIFVFTLAVKYVIEERNKKFIKDAMAKYVAPAVVDQIIKDPDKLALGGEKKDLTILFSDIRGFTSFSERMDAKALSQFLNDYLGIMTDIVFEFGGTLDKYIGDAVMAFWGAPLDQPDHAAKACAASAKMLQALSANRNRWIEQYGVEVAIGIGINSGPVNVGNMGSLTKFNYTVIGDHVNLASRLEGLTKYYRAGIVTTRFTLDMVQQAGQPAPSHRVLDFVKVKGKKLAVELIQILEREYSPEGLKAFDEARKLYSKQQWDQAIALFEKANALLRPSAEKDDGPSSMYLERCKEFKVNPPSADWDGSWEMHSK